MLWTQLSSSYLYTAVAPPTLSRLDWKSHKGWESGEDKWSTTARQDLMMPETLPSLPFLSGAGERAGGREGSHAAREETAEVYTTVAERAASRFKITTIELWPMITRLKNRIPYGTPHHFPRNTQLHHTYVLHIHACTCTYRCMYASSGGSIMEKMPCAPSLLRYLQQGCQSAWKSWKLFTYNASGCSVKSFTFFPWWILPPTHFCGSLSLTCMYAYMHVHIHKGSALRKCP